METPIPILLYCPMCNTRHIDEGTDATTAHHTHGCQNSKCGHVWRPAIVATVGVWFLPGFNKAVAALATLTDRDPATLLRVKVIAPADLAPEFYVHRELAVERLNQFAQWGGKYHDDEHESYDWVEFIAKQKSKLATAAQYSGKSAERRRLANIEYRARLVKIGALAIAAIESFDRKASTR